MEIKSQSYNYCYQSAKDESSKNSEYDHFLGILESGEFIKRDTLSEILDIRQQSHPLLMRYILKAEYRYTHQGSSSVTHWFQYKLMNFLGEPINLRIGDLRLNI